ncbi:MAG: gliding motility-associated C-terminal domain-containing protein [Bacteroidota bacterium]
MMLVRTIARIGTSLMMLLSSFLILPAQSGIIDLDFQVIDPTACNLANGEIRITATNGIAPYEYSINGGASFQSDSIFTDLGIGSYLLFVRDVQQQFSSFKIVQLQAEGAPTIRGIVMADAPECGTGGILKILAEDGIGDLQYSIDSGRTFQADFVFNDVPSGTYHIVVRNEDDSCPATYPAISFAPQSPLQYLTVAAETVHPECEMADGSITINASGGSGDYLYSIDGGTSFQLSNVFDSLGAGVYDVLVRDTLTKCEKAVGNGSITLIDQNCQDCDDVQIVVSSVNPDCNQNNGQIAVAATGGSGNFTYSLDNGVNFQPSMIFDSLGEGTYFLVVRDVNFSCEKEATNIVNLASSNCPDCDSLSVQSFLTVPDCDTANGRIELTVNGGSGAYQVRIDSGLYKNDLFFEDLANGTYTVSVRDTITGCEKVLPIINLMAQDCACSLDIFTDDSRTVTIENCSDGGLICLDISLEELMQLVITDNGFAYNTPLAGCDFDTLLSYLYFTFPGQGLAGPYRLDRWEINDSIYTGMFEDIHELVALMNTIDSLGNWQRDSASMTLLGGTTANSYGALEVTQLSTDMVGALQLNQNVVPKQAQLSLSEGIHELVFTDPTTNCTDSLMVEVICAAPLDTLIIDTIITVGAFDTICFPELLMDSTINSLTTICEGQSPAVGFEVNSLNACLVYEGLMVGEDTICLTVCSMDTICTEVIVTVTVIDSMMMDTMNMDSMMIDSMMTDTLCTPIFVENSAEVDLIDCDSVGQYCLGLSKAFLEDFDLTINDVLFNGIYPDCDVPEQASLSLPLGEYQLILKEKEGVCSDTATLVVKCMPEMNTFEDTIAVNETDTFCFDSLQLVGTIATIENTCEAASGEMVLFELDTINNCVIYTGIEPGSDRACITVCDSLDNCDSVMVTILVEAVPDSIPPPIAVDDRDTVEEGNIRTINVLGNDTTNSTLITVTIIENPSNGTVVVNGDMTVTYSADDIVCDTTDFFTYELCNPSGCDTARVDIAIICQNFTIFNGFSPNDDGINDTFTIDGIENFPNNRVQIFNRWGNLVYDQQGYKGQWDGTWNNQDLPSGTYFYLLDDGEGTHYSGFLQIYRGGE